MVAAAVLMMGMSAVLLQVAALRELLAVFSGNELDIGITLSVWLLSVGAGGILGRSLRGGNAFPHSFLVVAALAPLTFLGIGLIRPLLSLGLGETVPFSAALIATCLTLAPLGIALGVQFPMAAASLRGDAARVYGLEALGFFIGGVLFTLFLAGRMSSLQAAAVASVLNVLVAAGLMRSFLIAAFAALPFFFPPVIGRLISQELPRGVELVERTESRYGTIEVVRIGGEYSVYASGKLQYAYPDIPGEEAKVHPAMALHSGPRRVLAVGGSPALIQELLKHKPQRIDFVETDPALLSVSLGLLSGPDRAAAADSRVRMFTRDGRAFIKSSPEGEYDLILLNLPEPATANINRFYTSDFYREARRALGRGGVLVLTLPPSFGYMNSELRLANGACYRSLRTVFRTVETTAEEYGMLAASDGPLITDPEELSQRFVGREIHTAVFRPELLYDLFDPLSAARTRQRLQAGTGVNTDERPAAYLTMLMVWADMHGGRVLRPILRIGDRAVLFAILPAVAAALVFRRGGRAVAFTIFMTGASSMAFSLILLLAYQAMYGYVYVSLGLLTGCFMAGTGAGGLLLVKAGPPLPRLKVLQACSAAVVLIALFSLEREIFYYLISAMAGLTAGAEFAAAAQLRELDGQADRSGSLYAADLAGSCFGALLGSIMLVPLLGVRNALLIVVSWKLISLILLASTSHEKP